MIDFERSRSVGGTTPDFSRRTAAESSRRKMRTETTPWQARCDIYTIFLSLYTTETGDVGRARQISVAKTASQRFLRRQKCPSLFEQRFLPTRRNKTVRDVSEAKALRAPDKSIKSTRLILKAFPSLRKHFILDKSINEALKRHVETPRNSRFRSAKSARKSVLHGCSKSRVRTLVKCDFQIPTCQIYISASRRNVLVSRASARVAISRFPGMESVRGLGAEYLRSAENNATSICTHVLRES